MDPGVTQELKIRRRLDNMYAALVLSMSLLSSSLVSTRHQACADLLVLQADSTKNGANFLRRRRSMITLSKRSLTVPLPSPHAQSVVSSGDHNPR